MEVTLIVIRGKVNRGEIAFHPPAILGRSREADLTIAHPMVSRQHCELYEVDGLLMIRDLGSLNGTMVHDRRVTESALCPDDRFSIGPLTFQVQYAYDGDVSAVPPPKLAESEGATEAVPDGEPEPSGSPMFEEMGSEPVSAPAVDDGPWANAVPKEDEGPHTPALPAEDDEAAEAGSGDAVPDFLAPAEPDREEVSVSGSAAVESPPDAVSDALAPDALAEDDRAAERGGGKAQAGGPQPAKKKRGFRLWPFGGKKASDAKKAKPTAPSADDPTEPPVEEEGSADQPAVEPRGTQDTGHDEAVADFLATADAADAEEPEPNEPERESEPHHEDGPGEEAEPDDEDDAFEDFLKGLQ